MALARAAWMFFVPILLVIAIAGSLIGIVKPTTPRLMAGQWRLGRGSLPLRTALPPMPSGSRRRRRSA
jgi:hypothetical protein